MSPVRRPACAAADPPPGRARARGAVLAYDSAVVDVAYTVLLAVIFVIIAVLAVYVVYKLYEGQR